MTTAFFVYLCMHACEGQKSTLGTIPQESSALFSLKQSLSLPRPSTYQLDWLASELQGSTCYCFPNAGITNSYIPQKFLNTTCSVHMLLTFNFWRQSRATAIVYGESLEQSWPTTQEIHILDVWGFCIIYGSWVKHCQPRGKFSLEQCIYMSTEIYVYFI